MLAFVSTQTFVELANLMGWHGCYWLLATICAGGGIFTFFIIPETKGKSSEEIQRYFGGETHIASSTSDTDEEHTFLKGEKYEIDIDNNVNISSIHKV